MAYAQLVFSPTASAGQVLKGIAKALLGETNLNAIEGLNQFPIGDVNNLNSGIYISEISNPRNEHWNLAYPSTLPALGDYAMNTFTVTLPCTVSSKNKFVRFILTTSTGGFTEPTGDGQYGSLLNYTLQVQGLSNIDSQTAATTNLTWRHSGGTQAQIIRGATATNPLVVTLSWSSSHILVVTTLGGGTSSYRSTLFLCSEIEENPITTFSNCAPVVYYSGQIGGTPGALTAPSATLGVAINVVNWFDPVVGSAVPVRAITQTSGNTLAGGSALVLGTTDAASLQKLTVYNQGRNWQVSPLLINDCEHGNTLLDLTKKSDVWLFAAGVLDSAIFSFNSKQYKSVLVHSSSTGTSPSTLLVRYG